ncbi:MAG: transposase [Flavobacteriales bacterium]
MEKKQLRLRKKVKEITLDMTGSIILIAKKPFPNAVLVIDRFHVQKLANESVQELRVKHRWQAIDSENESIEKAKQKKA